MKTTEAKWRRVALIALLLFFGIILAPDAQAQDEEYDLDFDIPEVEDESRFEIWGQAEFKFISRFLDESSDIYKQKFYKTGNQENPALEQQLQIKPEISWGKGEFGAYLRPRLTVNWSQMPKSKAVYDEPSEPLFIGDEQWRGEILAEEGYLNWSPSPSLSFEVGKKVLKWGKGYAWNPVSFVSRIKDVNDPDSSREGYVLGFADYIVSMDGPVSTIAFTPVVSTVNDNINQGLARDDTTLFGGKVYVLAYDMDFDFMAVAGEKYDTRIGMDFATNLADNFAIHAEAGLRMGYEKQIIDSAGNVDNTNINAWSFLLGMRYLTETDTTYLVEYYHNGQGYSQTEMRDYYTLIEDGYDAYTATGAGGLLKSSKDVSSTYNASTSGRDYLYVRISQKEPFDILYLTPTLTTIVNLGDGSFTLNPEVSYLVSESFEVRPRLVIPIGPAKSEYGEKVNAVNGELRLTYFF
jgi:hypothetical protein